MLIVKMPDTGIPDWMDKTGVGVVGSLAMDDGKKMNVEITGFNEESDELIVQVISSAHSHSEAGQEDRAIPSSRIISFDPQPRETQSWPYSDPCRGGPFSFARFALMTTILLGLAPGGLALFILFLNREAYRLQELSAISYTLFEVFFTFAANRGLPRFKFTCPAVKPQLPHMLWRHLGFLIALFAFQTLALAARPSLPAWWNTRDAKGATPFELTVLISCLGLGYFQVFTNRSLLSRAHREYSA